MSNKNKYVEISGKIDSILEEYVITNINRGNIHNEIIKSIMSIDDKYSKGKNKKKNITFIPCDWFKQQSDFGNITIIFSEDK